MMRDSRSLVSVVTYTGVTHCLVGDAAVSATPSSSLDIAHHFRDLSDPRHPAFRDHHLLGDILVIALCAVLSGADSWEDIAEFGRSKDSWLRGLGLRLPNGSPAHDTFNRVFADLNPDAFQGCFTTWINAVCGDLGFCHIPVDGKTARGTRGPDGTALHLVSAWASAHRLSLAQVAVADKSNEITAIPRLLRLLELRGALVTIDAMGCQKDIAKQIVSSGGDYLLAVKDNQPTLHADVAACFADTPQGVRRDTARTQETGHGRHEERQYTVLYAPPGLSTQDEWAGLKSVVRVERRRQEGTKEPSTEVAYYISSSTLSAAILGSCIRDHWGIENGQHWVLDVVFGEDGCRTRQGHAAENLAWLRKMVLSLLRQDNSKGSAPNKRLRAALNDDYRRQLLNLLLQ
jgi:predicted transposase YbfD/YdcC